MFKLIVLSAIIATVYGLPKLHLSKSVGRIVGGNETTIEEYPYQVSVLYLGSHICGGSVVDRDTIVTSAHCIYNIESKYLRVRAGSTTLNSGGVLVEVANIIYHYWFNHETQEFDLAILKLTSLLTYDETIQPIPLNYKDPFPRTSCEVTGWGAIDEGGSASENLKVVDVSIISREKCNEIYNGSVSFDMICAGDLEGGKDSCDGDFGGPLKCEGKLFGIVSWGEGCARPGYPKVYTNIYEFEPWIEANM